MAVYIQHHISYVGADGTQFARQILLFKKIEVIHTASGWSPATFLYMTRELLKYESVDTVYAVGWSLASHLWLENFSIGLFTSQASDVVASQKIAACQTCAI